VAFPLGRLVAVSGVSGSGKSSLVQDVLSIGLAATLNRNRTLPGRHKRIDGIEHVDKVINIDQSPIGRTPRSNAATYTGVFDKIRTFNSRRQGAGLQAGPLQLQRQGGALRGLQR
jgi:excinuclease ABC subunit A